MRLYVCAHVCAAAPTRTSHDTRGACPVRGYSSQAFLLKLKEGKARWPPIPFRVMLPKLEWLHQRTDKVKAAAILRLRSIVSPQMALLQFRAYPPLAPLILDLTGWSALLGNCCCC